MAEERKATNQDFNDVTGSEFLMQSILGKLYSILTTGNEVAPPSNDNFFAWATPGYPVTAKYFEFAYLGTTGETIDPKDLKKRALERIDQIKQLREASGQEEVKFSAEELMAEVKDELQKEAAQRRSNAAFDFSNLVDFVPDVSGNSQEPLKTQYSDGSLSDIYEHTLTMAQVKNYQLTEQQKQVVEQIQALLGETIETPEETKKEDNAELSEMEKFTQMLSGLDGDESSDSSASKAIVKKSPYMEAYLRYEALYLQALDEYRVGLNAGTLGSLADRNGWNNGGESIARRRVDSAMREWVVSGHKNTIEKLTAQKEAIEARDFSIILFNYKQLLTHSKISSGRRQYLDTTLTPSDFIQSGGWTRFTFSNKELDEYSNSKYHQHSRSIKTKTGSIFHRTSTTNTNEDTHLDISRFFHDKEFNLSFDFCQVKIVRPWFKESFLSSRYWRFSPETSKGDILSDGGDPPQGMLPAYPTSILFIRNLQLSYEDGTETMSLIEDYEKNYANYSGGLRFGWFNIGASAGYAEGDTDYGSDWNHTYQCTKQGITVPGIQIIGYNCHILGKSPNPDPSISEDDWI